VTTLLIDADYFFYRAAAALEEEHDYNEELTVIVGNFAEAKKVVINELNVLKQRFETDKLILTFTDRSNFRKTIDPNYKGNRTKRKPCGYLRLKNWGMETFKSIMKPGLEADDVCGIMATNGQLKDFVLVSPDKDLEQIPCRIFNLKQEFTQTPEAARRKLFEQCLTGDQTDGFAGCPGVGPKKADAILRSVEDEDYWPAVLKAYIQAQQTEEDAIRNLRLARILQAPDWNSKAQVPILYTP
jgi:DNA polymerase-1